MERTTEESRAGSETKTYTFEVVMDEDAFDDSPMVYHAYCPSLI